MSSQEQVATPGHDVEAAAERGSRLKDFYANPWTQIILISVICFCCPGVSHKHFKSSIITDESRCTMPWVDLEEVDKLIPQLPRMRLWLFSLQRLRLPSLLQGLSSLLSDLACVSSSVDGHTHCIVGVYSTLTVRWWHSCILLTVLTTSRS